MIEPMLMRSGRHFMMKKRIVPNRRSIFLSSDRRADQVSPEGSCLDYLNVTVQLALLYRFVIKIELFLIIHESGMNVCLLSSRVAVNYFALTTINKFKDCIKCTNGGIPIFIYIDRSLYIFIAETPL